MGTRAETTRKEKAILKFIENQVNKNGYPPEPTKEAYDEIMKQVENFKKFDNNLIMTEDDLEEFNDIKDNV